MNTRKRLAVALLSASAAASTFAQGIPVIDSANLAQSIQQVINAITQINNQLQQITQLQAQINSTTGQRFLGNVLNNPLLENYIPAEAYRYLNTLNRSGYSALSETAKALRDAAMVYNCSDRKGTARTDCEADLARPYQEKGMLQDAMRSAAGRLDQINALLDAVDSTTDQKSIQEIQARITAENAMLAHEVSQVQMLQGMADSEERIARSRDRERVYEMTSRTGSMRNFLNR